MERISFEELQTYLGVTTDIEKVAEDSAKFEEEIGSVYDDEAITALVEIHYGILLGLISVSPHALRGYTFVLLELGWKMHKLAEETKSTRS